MVSRSDLSDGPSAEWPEKTFLGGHPVLNFLNTAGGDTKARDVERLVSFSSFLSWSHANDIISADELAVLSVAASKAMEEADRQLAKAVTYREAVYDVLNDTIQGRPPQRGGLEQIEEGFRSALANAHLTRDHGTSFAWSTLPDEAGLDLPRQRLALSVPTFLTQVPVADISQCEACSWMYIDATASKRRRWCSMALCGNRAKAQRHYHRERGN